MADGLSFAELEVMSRLGASLWCGHYRCGSRALFNTGGRIAPAYFYCLWHRELEPRHVILVEPDWKRDDGGLPNYDWGPT